jgi:predicted DsbA family dithiol-disulfide isomerase
VDKRAYLVQRFGSEDQLNQIHQRFRDIAAKAGVTMDPDTPSRIPNTLNAHRLIHWAGLEGRQTPMVSALFRAYWVEGRDIGNPDVLADLSAEAGMDRAAVARLLSTDADLAEIQARESHARARGVNAVPTFLLANHYVLSGAQPPEVWGQVMEDLAAKA